MTAILHVSSLTSSYNVSSYLRKQAVIQIPHACMEEQSNWKSSLGPCFEAALPGLPQALIT